MGWLLKAEWSELVKSDFLLLSVLLCEVLYENAQSLVHSMQEHQEIQAEFHSLLLCSSEGVQVSTAACFCPLMAYGDRFYQIQPLFGSARTLKIIEDSETELRGVIKRSYL